MNNTGRSLEGTCESQADTIRLQVDELNGNIAQTDSFVKSAESAESNFPFILTK